MNPLFSRRSAIASANGGGSLHHDVPFDLSVTDTTGWAGCEDLELSALQALVHPAAIRYVPDSVGSLDARRALASLQEPHDPSRWILTASSSEAYSLLFQLLCDPDTTVATPRPGYPLVDELGRFHDVSVSPIPLRRNGSTWSLDLGWTERRLRDGVRALVLIQPANPTGWILSPPERRAVLELCATYKVPLISDEVFEAWTDSSFESLATQNEVLCFTLGGLSKLLGLPHLKLGWIRLSGPEQLVLEARARLEVLNDALLSASTPIQQALPTLLSRKDEFQDRIRDRLDRNRASWRDFQGRIPDSYQALEANHGWFCLLQWKHPLEEARIHKMLLEKGVNLLPGYLFDLPEAGLVASLITPPSVFLHGLVVLSDLLISLELEQ